MGILLSGQKHTASDWLGDLVPDGSSRTSPELFCGMVCLFVCFIWETTTGLMAYLQGTQDTSTMYRVLLGLRLENFFPSSVFVGEKGEDLGRE